ncbi:MAG: HipA N-terminal domain-containing protein [Kiritimatiellia bacterium]
MRKGLVRVCGRDAGVLEETSRGFRFRYHDGYLVDPNAPSVSLRLPKSRQTHESNILFPFFFGLLAEGNLKAEQCRRLKLDEDDAFGRLIQTAGSDTIGAVSVHPENAG